MKTIKEYPSQDELRRLFDYDAEKGALIWKKVAVVNQIKIGSVAGCLNSKGYTDIGINRSTYKAHRLIWIWHNDEIPSGMLIDHIDNIKSNNHIENLQIVTNKQNQMKKTMLSNNATGFKGVSYEKCSKKFKACIRVDNKRKNLGRFTSPIAAARAYDIAALKYYGDFANTNFSREDYQQPA